MTNSFQPELQATAKDLDEVKRLAEAGADALIIGHQDYGIRVAGDFTIDQIAEATTYLHEQNKRIYLLVNAIFHNEHIETLPSYLRELERLNVDGIVCGDPSIFQMIKDIDLSIPLTWNPETLSTNYQTLRFWHQRGLSRAILSNELALDAIKEIKQAVSFPIEIQVHGMTCIFQSKRKLVRNYYQHIDKAYDSDKPMFLKQEKKDETHYPVYEDVNGTHIMSNEDLAMVDYLDAILEAEIDGLKINGLLKSTDYNEKIVKIYREAVDTYLKDPASYQMKKTGWKQQIFAIQPEDRKLDTGFYFKEQIY
ncbi:putative protease [Natronobacillus azotifigens]|uniref:U32 family peptidase n=1 Tax=Natronobacillus azotifigens TaxID=472978 RepID=A0A9J6R8G2_9BACI|nr:peptidase U32 family protein [Natronobacillus azotifigens]MCZ0701917.1 U32 family peptidase [Natronobacillus azotifigens]